MSLRYNAHSSEANASTLNLSQFVEQYGILGLIADRMDVDIANLPLLIDDKNRSLCEPFRSQHAELQRGVAVGPEVADQRVRNPTERFRPRFDCRNGVDANTQDLGIIPVELWSVLLVRRHL